MYFWGNNINGIENFWGLCKVRLAKFRGLHKHKFYYHIKGGEFRYNNRNKSLETFEKYKPNKRKVSIFLFLYKIRQNHY